MNMMREIRRALNDIQQSMNNYDDHRVRLQVYHLRVMIDERQSRQKPWSHYQEIIEEEFES